MTNTRFRSVIAEALGTGLLLFVIVASGITAERMSGDPGLQLLLHAVAVGTSLAVLISVFAGISGAHFNPAVTFGIWRRGNIDASTALTYMPAQLVGAVAGVAVANLVMSESVFGSSAAGQITGGSVVGEFIGTFFLVLVILALVDQDRRSWIPAAVGGWVAAMILATPSGGLLNPAVSLARTLADTYTGIASLPAVVFTLTQLLAGAAAVLVSRQLTRTPELKGT